MYPILLFCFFSGPADSTHLPDQSTASRQYGTFNLSVITAASSSSTFNSTYTVEPDTVVDPPSVLTDTSGDQADQAHPSHVDLTASFDITRRDVEDPTEVHE